MFLRFFLIFNSNISSIVIINSYLDLDDSLSPDSGSVEMAG